MTEKANGKKLIGNMLWKFAERILAQFISLIVSIVLARILLPEEYGTIAMVTVFIAFLDVFVNEGLPTALVQKQKTDEIDFSSVFYFNVLFSISLYLLLFFCAPLISTFYNNGALTIIIRVMGLRIIVASVNSVQHAYVSKNMMFKKYFWSTLFGTLTSAAIGIWLAYNGAGVWALVAQYMTNTVIDTVFLWFSVGWRPKRVFDWQRVKVLISFGWKVLFEGLSETFSQQVRSLIIGKVYSSADLAYYNKAQQFPQLFISNICTAISSVLLPEMSNKQDQKEYIVSLLRKSTKLASFVIFPLLTGLGVAAEPFIKVVLTEKWISCVPYLQIFCFTQALTVGMITRHQALLSTGRSDIYMKEHILYRIFFLTLLFSIFRKGVMAIAISTIVGTLFMAFTVVYTSKKYNNYSVRDQILDLLPIIIGCIVMAIPIRLIGIFSMSDILKLFIQVIVGMVIYAVYARIVHLEEILLCKSIIDSYLGKIKK